MFKILIILPDLNIGGAQRNTINIANKLSEKYRVKLVFINNTDQNFILNKNIEKIFLNHKRIITSFYSILREIKFFKPKIIYSSIGYINLYMIIINFFFIKKHRLIIREANLISTNINNLSTIKGIIYKFLYKKLYKFADIIICSSKEMKKDMIKLMGKEVKNKIFIMNNFLDKNNIKLSIKDIRKEDNKEIKLIAAGRLNKQKGFDLIINHFIKFKYQNIRLNIFGEGNELNNLNKLIIKNNLHFVKIYNFTNDIWKYIHNSDYYLFASRWEGMPNIVLESLVCGTKILNFSDIKQLDEIYAKKNDNIINLDINKKIDWDVFNYKYSKEDLLPLKFDINENIKEFEKLFTKKL